MIPPGSLDVRATAEKEIREEDFRSRVDAAKIQIRTHIPWYHQIFPWKIVITRRNP